MTAFTVTLGVPVNPSAFVARVAESAFPVTFPVTSPVKLPTKPPVEVVTPETVASPVTLSLDFGCIEPIPTFALIRVVIPT